MIRLQIDHFSMIPNFFLKHQLVFNKLATRLLVRVLVSPFGCTVFLVISNEQYSNRFVIHTIVHGVQAIISWI